MLSSLSNDEIEDRFFLQGRMEILSVLNELILRRELVTVYFNEGRDVMVSTLLEARVDRLIFDLSGDAQANRKLPNSPSCVFAAMLNGIRVQFSCAHPQKVSWGGSDAFEISLPERVIRVQRRESYRVTLPVAKPVMVSIYDESYKSLGEWQAHDLSVGGMAFVVHGEPAFEVGQRLAHIHLPLLKKHAVKCAAVVRHVTQVANTVRGPTYRVGVSFSGLPMASGVTIQRYIIKAELQRRGVSYRPGLDE